MLCMDDLHDASRRRLFAGAYVPGTVAPHELLVLPTHGTKTCKLGRSKQDPVLLYQHTDVRYCCLRRLWAFLDLLHLSGHNVQHYIFRPQTAQHDGFREAPFSSSSFSHLVYQRLAEMGDYEGETPHSFRRGTLQATASAAGGGLVGQLAAAVQGRILTPAIVERYLDRYRHLAR